jgi:hypothetical protein
MPQYNRAQGPMNGHGIRPTAASVSPIAACAPAFVAESPSSNGDVLKIDHFDEILRHPRRDLAQRPSFTAEAGSRGRAEGIDLAHDARRRVDTCERESQLRPVPPQAKRPVRADAVSATIGKST